MKTFSCSVGYHCGGLGQHFSFMVEEARREGLLHRYYAPSIRPGDQAGRVTLQRLAPFLIRWTPIRFHPGWRWHVDCELWDRKIAGILEPPLHTIAAFGGQALHTFRAARKLGAVRLELIAANSHVNNAWRLYERATARYPFEKPWLCETHRRKTLREYEVADIIWIASEYSMRTFLAEGIAASKLKRVHYPADARFIADPSQKPNDGVFRVVYVGALTVAKGIPLLLETFERFDACPAELILVGSSSSRGMRRYLEQRTARDPRVRLAPGDPLPHLRRADVYVHPSWEDNYAYAAVEAISAGVPAILTADTGAREFIVEGKNGHIIPTGDGDALLDRLNHWANVTGKQKN